MTAKFTIDGSSELENRLDEICGQVRHRVTAIIPERDLEAIVLGGGYGRGEGGVLRTTQEDEIYNDLEFYVFVRGNRLRQDQKFARPLHDLSQDLSNQAEVQIEFKIDSANRLRRSPVSMFSYDLISGHRIVFGEESIFEGCERHLDASSIPLSEATRLIFNRGSGLLLTRELLEKNELSSSESDFIGRNLAKIQLALGDAVLTVFGQYHWSVRERCRRLEARSFQGVPPWLPAVQDHHWAGVVFKLHPRRVSKTIPEFQLEFWRLAELTLAVWLWLESRRLNQRFLSARDYALSDVDKCPETSIWRNYLLNLRTFGPKGMLRAMSWRYPRERLFDALTLLLWHSNAPAQPRLLQRLHQVLETDASDWPGLVNVFKGIWPGYG